MLYLLIIAFLALAAFILRKHDEERRLTGVQMFWATVAEPLVYIQQDVEDSDVEARAANAREQLQKHGNKYLRSSDVWVYLYRLTDQNTGSDFALWQDQAFQEIARRRAEWRQHKLNNAPAAAAQVIGGQRPANVVEWN